MQRIIQGGEKPTDAYSEEATPRFHASLNALISSDIAIVPSTQMKWNPINKTGCPGYWSEVAEEDIPGLFDRFGALGFQTRACSICVERHSGKYMVISIVELNGGNVRSRADDEKGLTTIDSIPALLGYLKENGITFPDANVFRGGLF